MKKLLAVLAALALCAFSSRHAFAQAVGGRSSLEEPNTNFILTGTPFTQEEVHVKSHHWIIVTGAAANINVNFTANLFYGVSNCNPSGQVFNNGFQFTTNGTGDGQSMATTNNVYPMVPIPNGNSSASAFARTSVLNIPQGWGTSGDNPYTVYQVFQIYGEG